MIETPVREALTFDDVLLVPAYSEVVPAQVSTQTRLTRKITLNTPLLSAAFQVIVGGVLVFVVGILIGSS